MAKKNQRGDLESALKDYDPRIQKLGIERFLSGEQIFDYRTKKLRSRYRDLTRTQLNGLLVCAKLYAKKLGKENELILKAKEKKLLAKIFVLSDGDTESRQVKIDFRNRSEAVPKRVRK